jgi:hypothetical protein
MRENRLYGSEGGEPANPASLPLSLVSLRLRGGLVLLHSPTCGRVDASGGGEGECR